MLKRLIPIIAICTAVASASAQDFLRRPSPIAGRSFLTLALFEEVRTELKISSDVNGKIDGLAEKMPGEMQQAFTDSGGDPTAMQGAIAKLNTKYDDDTLKVLSDDQTKRLKGLFIQFNGSSAAGNAVIGKDLEITDDEKTKIKKLQDDQFKKMFDLFSSGSSPEDNFKAIKELFDELNAGVDKVLTDDQKKKLKEMAGAKFEFKKSESGLSFNQLS